jgi:cullin-associated NEDD8-dissociated protein 1
MDTAFSRMNHADIFDRVVAGLRDEHDIKMLCNLMLSKLIILDPDETIRRLDTISECYKATLSVKLKDNAVKQEIEKANDASKDALRVSVRLQAAFQAAANTVGPTQAQGWRSYWDWVGKDFKNQLQAAEADVKSQG